MQSQNSLNLFQRTQAILMSRNNVVQFVKLFHSQSISIEFNYKLWETTEHFNDSKVNFNVIIMVCQQFSEGIHHRAYIPSTY